MAKAKRFKHQTENLEGGTYCEGCLDLYILQHKLMEERNELIAAPDEKSQRLAAAQSKGSEALQAAIAAMVAEALQVCKTK